MDGVWVNFFRILFSKNEILWQCENGECMVRSYGKSMREVQINIHLTLKLEISYSPPSSEESVLRSVTWVSLHQGSMDVIYVFDGFIRTCTEERRYLYEKSENNVLCCCFCCSVGLQKKGKGEREVTYGVG